MTAGREGGREVAQVDNFSKLIRFCIGPKVDAHSHLPKVDSGDALKVLFGKCLMEQ